MKARVEIRTKLDESIERCVGGGRVQIYYTYATAGPRTLYQAAEKLKGHKKFMEQCYGNIGCGCSYIVIVSGGKAKDITSALLSLYSDAIMEGKRSIEGGLQAVLDYQPPCWNK